MAAPTIDTEVTYPAGAVTSEGTVVHVEPVGGDRWAVFLDRTAAHPVDTAWPDPPALGDRATVTVDRGFRTALSVAHSACHLAALALDAVLTDRWSKPVPEDSLGRPAFDSLAIVRSSIGEYRSEDVYRIGKSLRKKGFDPGAFDDADGIADRVTGLLRAWTATGGPIHVVAEDSRLSARRQWRCELPDGVAAIPCGGTHPDALSDLVDPTVAISVEDVPGARVVTMTTTLTPR